MKKTAFIVLLLLTLVVAYILKTEGRGRYIPTFTRPTSEKFYEFIAKHTPKKKTLRLEIDGQDVLRSQSEILNKLRRIPSGQHKKIIIKKPNSILTGVRCGDKEGLKRFDEQCERNYELMKAEIYRITGVPSKPSKIMKFP